MLQFLLQRELGTVRAWSCVLAKPWALVCVPSLPAHMGLFWVCFHFPSWHCLMSVKGAQ